MAYQWKWWTGLLIWPCQTMFWPASRPRRQTWTSRKTPWCWTRWSSSFLRPSLWQSWFSRFRAGQTTRGLAPACEVPKTAPALGQVELPSRWVLSWPSIGLWRRQKILSDSWTQCNDSGTFPTLSWTIQASWSFEKKPPGTWSSDRTKSSVWRLQGDLGICQLLCWEERSWIEGIQVCLERCSAQLASRALVSRLSCDIDSAFPLRANGRGPRSAVGRQVCTEIGPKNCLLPHPLLLLRRSRPGWRIPGPFSVTRSLAIRRLSGSCSCWIEMTMSQRNRTWRYFREGKANVV